MLTSKKMLARVVSSRSLFFSTAIITSLVIGGQVVAQVNERADYYDIPAQSLEDSLNAFAMQADVEVLYTSDDVRALKAPAISGAASREQAIGQLLAGTGLTYRFTDSGTLIVRAPEKTSANRGLPPSRIELARVMQPRAAAAVTAAGQSGTASDAEEDWGEGIEEMEEMVVTGSNIRGIAPESSPLFVFDRAEIDRTGFSTVEQLIEAIPQNFGGGAALDTLGTLPESRDAARNSVRASTVNLRGLGSDSTLVLLNGRRLTPTAGSAFVDISAIPLSAVERVEVLTDGASATYGSDAIAGVINFVLRRDYDGAETLLRYGTVTNGGLDEYKASQTFGKAWGSGNALIVYEYFNRDGLSVADRDFALAAGAPSTFDLLPVIERHSVFASGSQKITDRLEVFSDVLYASRDSESSTGAVLIEELTSDTEQYNISSGAMVDLFGDWRLYISGSYGQDKSDVSLNFVEFDFISEVEFDNTLWAIDAKVDGSLIELPGGDVKFALGMGYRETEFETVSVTRGTTFGVDRDVLAVFGELFVPLVSNKNRLPGVERLEVSVAGRFEDYSDFGSSTDPKVGVLWSPVSGLKLRGTFSTSFRAPDLSDLDPSRLEGVLSHAFDPNAADETTLVLALTGSFGDLGPEQSTAWTVGLDYEPELVPGLRFSATYYDIEFDDRIDSPAFNFLTPITQPDVFAPVLTFNPTAEEIASALASAAVFSNFTLFPGEGPASVPEDAEVIVDNSLQNLSITNTRGIDFLLSYLLETDAGDFGFGFNASYIFEFEQAITVTSPVVDLVDTVFNPTDFRFRANASWSKDGFAAAAFFNHTGGYTDNVAVPETDVDSWTTVDLSLSFNTEDRFGTWLLDNVRLSLSVQNVFDEDPPFVLGAPPPAASVGYDPANATPLGRFIAVQVSKAW